ncbi:Tol-Pal system protein TolB [Paraconexibacter sp. AEG42_29]|uniref:Tol-Pal system protein TolB n=1 Tax=Paraconexibacter sp. AEG42_29 TaxID=2997339 RepID=A0AAU7B357_9ACTN
MARLQVRRRGTTTLLVAVAAALAGCGDDEARTGASTTGAPVSSPAATSSTALAVAKPVVKKSPDSEAPATAPAHWLPPAAWVYNHWLPYDESRLYALLGITREQLWAQLRDDKRTLAQLAAEHGHPDPAKLAAELVAPRAAAVGPTRAAELRRRAVSTITQGHLAQHLFFHSLHQFAIPSAAPDIFGVTDATFRELRRQELSPLAIGRLQGRSPAAVEGQAIAVLHERVQSGVKGGAMSAEQGRLLLRRQLTQLPRWLDQARYNGPPTTHRGDLVQKPKDYASNPAISATGRFVAYEAYRQKLPLAVKLGEIAVLRADLRTGRTRLVSAIPGKGTGGPNPISAYNPGISGDGRRVAYESSTGNQNFAKRYGRIGTLLADTRSGRIRAVGTPIRGTADSQSTWGPEVASDGRRMIYQAVRGGRTVVIARTLPSGAQTTVVAGQKAGAATYRDPFEPTVSADGVRVAYTLATGTVADAAQARSSIRVRNLRTGRVEVASRADGRGGAALGGFSADPAISPDGRFVAFTSTAPELGVKAGSVGLFLRDLDRGRTRRIPTGAARPLDPAVARRGRTVAFTAVGKQAAQVMAWDANRGTARVVSAAGGTGTAPADGFSSDPSISADGRRIAFGSTATDLGAGEGDGARAVYVHDRRTGRTRRVSDPEVAYAGQKLPPAKPAPAPPAAPPPAQPDLPATPDAVDAPSTVFVTDNAFVDGEQRPTVLVSPGTLVTWRWRSRQSHSVQLRTGPKRFASKVRQDGSFKYRFQEAGTYELVCSLHAPGMKMKVVVGQS